MAPDIQEYLYLFPREMQDRLDGELERIFSSTSDSTKYHIEDPDDGFVYLVMKRTTAIPRELEDFFYGLGGVKLNSKKELEDAMIDSEFRGTISVQDINRLEEIAGQKLRES